MKIKRKDLYRVVLVLIIIISLLAYEIHLHKIYSLLQLPITFLLVLIFALITKDNVIKTQFKKLIISEPFIIILIFLIPFNTILTFFIYKYNTYISIISAISFSITILVEFYGIPLLFRKYENIRKKVFEIYIGFSTFLSLFSITLVLCGNQFLGYKLVHSRVSSIYFDPNFLGVVLGISFFLIFFSKGKKSKKWFLVIVHAIAIYLSNSRGTFLSVFATLFIYYLIYSKMKIFKKIIILITMSVISFSFISYIYINTNYFRVYQGDNYRSEIIIYAIKLVKESPIIGYGYGSIAKNISKMGGTASVHASTHNCSVDFLFNYGVPAFLIFIFIIAKIMFKTIIEKKEEAKEYIPATIFALINSNTILYSFGGVGINSIMFTVLLGILNINTVCLKGKDGNEI